MRIVSLLAAGTEIVCRLGHRADLVGRSHECDHPGDVVALPAVSEPSFRLPDSSGAIDATVRDRVRRALSIYTVDAALLRELQPDVVVTQTQCEVCAVSPADLRRAACEWLDRDVRIIELRPHRLADIWDDVHRVARGLNDPDAGKRIVHELRESVASIARRTAPDEERPTVVTIEWLDPLMTAGNWMPELVSIAGGRQLLGEVGRHSSYIAWDHVVTADPDVLIVSPCGFDIPRTLTEMETLTSMPGWKGLRAVRSGAVYVVDGNAYFHRSGPRIVESAEILRSMLHEQAGSGPGFRRFRD